MEVVSASREDLPAMLSLLAANGLPPEGLEDHLGSAVVAREAGRVVGSAAMLGVYLDPWFEPFYLRSTGSVGP